jgi:hypothetical protein
MKKKIIKKIKLIIFILLVVVDVDVVVGAKNINFYFF